MKVAGKLLPETPQNLIACSWWSISPEFQLM